MNRYREVLGRFIATDLGDAETKTRERVDNTLRADLRNVIRSDTKYFNICIGLVLLLYVGAVWLVLTHLDNPAEITAVFSVTGISFAALIRQMTALWREKSKSEVAYTLAGGLPPDDLKAVIAILLKPDS